MNQPAIIIRSLDQAKAALAAAQTAGAAVILQSPENAAQTMGPALFKMIMEEAAKAMPDATFTAVYDCADKPGHATAALRAGITHILLACPDDARQKVIDMAGQMNASVVDASPTLFDPSAAGEDAETACLNWLKSL